MALLLHHNVTPAQAPTTQPGRVQMETTRNFGSMHLAALQQDTGQQDGSVQGDLT